MKQLKNKLVILISLVALFYACTKEISILDNFSFSLTETHDNEAFVFQAHENRFEIIPIRIVEGTTYTFEYKLLKGNGYYEKEGIILEPNIQHELTSLNFELNFIGEQIGENQTSISVKDNNENVDVLIMDYNSLNVPFTFTATPTLASINIDEILPINFTLSQNENDSNVEYSLFYEIVEGEGILLNDGVELPIGTPIDVSSGNWTYSFDPSVVAATTIRFTVNDTYGNVVIKEVQFNISEILFLFDAIGTVSSANINTGIIVNFNLTEINNTSSYTMIFESSHNATFTYDNVEYTAGENISVIPGAYSGIYNGINEGEHKITFTVTNSNDIPISESDEVEVTYFTDYTFTVAAQSIILEQNETTGLNLNIVEAVTTGDIYEVRYEYISGDALVTNDDITLITNTYYDIPLGESSWVFKGTNVGTINLEFTVRNKTTNITKTVNVIIEVSSIQNVSEFSFTAEKINESSAIENGTDINFSITELNDLSSNYTMVFNSSSNGEFLYNGITYTNGDEIDVNIGTFTGTYIGLLDGDHSVNFIVTNSNINPISQSQTIIIVVVIIIIDNDDDGDGVDNDSDNCPSIANSNQLDTDGDGIGDVCDSTPNGDVPVLTNLDLDYNNYSSVYTGSTLPGYDYYIELLLNNITYTSFTAITDIEINGTLYSISDINNAKINVGKVVYTSTGGGSVVNAYVVDTDITYKKNTSINIRLKNSEGFSNTITKTTTNVYGIPDITATGVYINGNYCCTTLSGY